MSRCEICEDPRRPRIDTALLARESAYTIANRFTLHLSSLVAHHWPDGPSHAQSAPEPAATAENFYARRDGHRATELQGRPSKNATPPRRVLTLEEQRESGKLRDAVLQSMAERPTQPGRSMNSARRRHLLEASYLGQQVLAATGAAAMTDARARELSTRYPSLRWTLEQL